MIPRLKVTPFECYKDYLALKQHFSSKGYDYVKYNGKVNAKPASFDSRRDKIFFMKLAKHPDPHNFLLSNMIVNRKLWIKDIAYNEQAHRVYEDWQKKIQSLSYTFKTEVSKLSDDFDENFVVADNGHPYALKLYLRGDISLETLVILVNMTKCIKHWDKKMEYDPVWEEVRLLLVKYSTFLKYDEQKMREIIVDKYQQ
jgi:hypothetical protein